MSYARIARILIVLAAAIEPRLFAQAPLVIGGEEERLLRWLQALDRAPLHQVSLRGYGPVELSDVLGDTAPGAVATPFTAGLTANSTFPWGANDGPVWAGRGLTGAVQGGLAWRWRAVSAVLAPMAFLAQNADFDLMSNARTGDTAFADGRFPVGLDRPQRFGDGRYAVLDPGASTVRLDTHGFTFGLSTANVGWGPAVRFPLLLGNNAAGFPHVFIGTSRGRDAWIARVHARLYWARLDASEWYFGAGERRRFGAGLAVVLEPHGLAGLEIGAARFYHQAWPSSGFRWSDVTKPFEGIFKSGLASDSNVGGQDPDNQLLSVFARWMFVDAGFELYGEFGREDHNWDLDDLLLEPDHSAAWLLGFAKVWRRETRSDVPGGGRRVFGFVGVRGELANSQKNHIDVTRDQGTWYTHATTLQGHTQRGQILGSDAIHGGAGAWLAIDWYGASGRWTLSWTRELRQQLGQFLVTGSENPRGLDVTHALGAERLLRRGNLDLLAGLTAVYNFNRNYGGDAVNVNAQVRVTAYPGGRPSRLPWPGH